MHIRFLQILNHPKLALFTIVLQMPQVVYVKEMYIFMYLFSGNQHCSTDTAD